MTVIVATITRVGKNSPTLNYNSNDVVTLGHNAVETIFLNYLSNVKNIKYISVPTKVSNSLHSNFRSTECLPQFHNDYFTLSKNTFSCH